MLQNKILRPMLFVLIRTEQIYFIPNLKILKLDEMIALEYTKFIFKFNNHMLPDSFNHYFTKLDSVLKYNIEQKQRDLNSIMSLIIIQTNNSCILLFQI